MAFTKDITWMTFEVQNAYASIMDFVATKQYADDGTKSFSVNVHTNVYKDSTKEVCLYGVQDVVTAPYNDGTVSLADLYTQLATLPDWEGWSNA